MAIVDTSSIPNATLPTIDDVRAKVDAQRRRLGIDPAPADATATPIATPSEPATPDFTSWKPETAPETVSSDVPVVKATQMEPEKASNFLDYISSNEGMMKVVLPALAALESVATQGKSPGTVAMGQRDFLVQQADRERRAKKDAIAEKVTGQKTANESALRKELAAVDMNAPDADKQVAQIAMKYGDPSEILSYAGKLATRKQTMPLTTEEVADIAAHPQVYGNASMWANDPAGYRKIRDAAATSVGQKTELHDAGFQQTTDEKKADMEQAWKNHHPAKTVQFDEHGGLVISQKQQQFDEGAWPKFMNLISPLHASSRSAVGVAALANMRADRALAILNDPNSSVDAIKQLVQPDLYGIMNGGVPHSEQLKEGYQNSLGADLAAKWQYLTGDPQKYNNPDIRAQLKAVILGLKQVDNDIISKNAGVAEASYPGLISRHPDWYSKAMGALDQNPNPVTIKSFATEAEAEVAATRHEIQAGDKIIVAGRPATWQ
jgi:hypothetical protein